MLSRDLIAKSLNFILYTFYHSFFILSGHINAWFFYRHHISIFYWNANVLKTVCNFLFWFANDLFFNDKNDLSILSFLFRFILLFLIQCDHCHMIIFVVNWKQSFVIITLFACVCLLSHVMFVVMVVGLNFLFLLWYLLNVKLNNKTKM